MLQRIVVTCPAMPWQCDAWDDTGHYFYLRYRFGRGSIDFYEGGLGVFEARWGDSPYSGECTLVEFLSHFPTFGLSPGYSYNGE